MVAALTICLALMVSCAQRLYPISSNGGYEYPVMPGTEEWKALTSHEQMLQVCQIPASALRKMSTKDLILTVINYPLCGDMLAYSTPQQGFDAVKSQFNGLQQLLRRDDAGVELVAAYHELDPLAVDESWVDAQKGGYSFLFMTIETILAQDVVLSRLTESQLQELLAETLEKYETKQQHALYGGLSLNRTIWVMGKTLQKSGYPSFTKQVQQNTRLQSFLADGFFVDDTVLDTILLYAEEVIAGK